MKKMYFCVVLVLTILLVPCAILTNSMNPTNMEPTMEMTNEAKLVSASEREPGPLVTNVISNPSFEEVESNGVPNDWSWGCSTYKEINASYTDDTNSGSYSARIRGLGTTQISSDAYLRRYTTSQPYPYLDQGIELDMYWKVVSNPDISDYAQCYFTFRIYDGSSNYYMNYYVSYNQFFNPSNSSNTANFLMNNTMGDWHNFNHNITADYEEAFAPVTPTTRFYRMDYHATSIVSPTGMTELLVDDISLTNYTSYEFLSQNGNFEAGDESYWSYTGRDSPGYIYSSTDSTDGQFSLNLTTQSVHDGSYGYAYVSRYFSYPQGYYAGSNSHLQIEFDWKYSDVSGGGTDQEAYFQIYQYNDTSGSWRWLRWHLGRDKDSNPQSNSTNNIYFNASQFGSRDVWEHFSLDLCEVYDNLDLQNIAMTHFNIYVELGDSANSSITLLIDDFKLITYPNGDPGFEQDWRDGSSSYVTSWSNYEGAIDDITRTTDSHLGDYALNFTLENNEWAGLARYDVWLSIDSATYTDFWWRLDDFTSTTGSLAYVRLYFEGGYNLRYYFASDASYNPTNDSNDAYYFLENINQTGSWFNLQRNITHDLNSTFGVHLWNLTAIYLQAYADTGSDVSIIFDDMNFIDMEAPSIDSITSLPVAPMYYEPTIIRSQATDNRAGVMSVEVYYSIGTGWISSEAELIGDYYEATIPAQAFGSIVEYYVNATDWCGQIAIDDNSSSYYSFTPGDDIDPLIDFNSPYSGIQIVGDVLLNISAVDAGSGIDYVEFLYGAISIETVSENVSGVYTYLWDSRTAPNGTHTIYAVAHDIVGLTTTVTIELDIQNDLAAPMLSEILLNPTTPLYDQDVFVSVAATDVSSVVNTTLHYKIGEGTWESIPMVQSGALYTSTIPAADWGTEVSYYVTSYDVFDQVESIGSELAPLTYIVSDNVNPLLGVSGPSIGTPVTGTVQLLVSATDAGSGIDNVRFYVDGVLVETLTTSPYTIAWDTLAYENGNHTLAFVTVDNAGNEVLTEIAYEVENPLGFDAIADGLNNFMTQYGFFVGAATVIGGFGAMKILMNRRASGKAGASKRSTKKSTKKTKKKSKPKK
ncbi:MAG: Ig-like domain-containing protein [Candidatus Thorarchaeota archaeon]